MAPPSKLKPSVVSSLISALWLRMTVAVYGAGWAGPVGRAAAGRAARRRVTPETAQSLIPAVVSHSLKNWSHFRPVYSSSSRWKSATVMMRK